MKNIIPVKTGEQIELVVVAMASSGDGICRHDGYTIFLPSGILQDRVVAEITKTTPRFATAKVIELITPSPFRENAPCSVFPQCGGCRFQDLKYEQQMEFKVKTVADALSRIGGIEPSIEIKSMPAQKPWLYRNRARFSISKTKGKISIGFLKRGSHQIVDSNQCGILIDPINEIKEWIRTILQKHEISIFDPRRRKGFLGGLVIHHSESTGESIIGFLTTKGHFPKAIKAAICDPEMLIKFGIVGIIQTISPSKTTISPKGENRVLSGQSFLKEKLNDISWRLSLGSFFQVNPKQTIKLYDLVREWACQDTKNLVVDVYCGNGGISLWLAKAGLQIIGIEESELAIDDARESSILNGIDHCQFLAGKAEVQLTKLPTDKHIGTIIVDPPRQGCSSEVVQAIIDIAPKKIIYVSCNPATLARDLAKLNSYKIQDICVVDMFPQTQHVETAVHLERQ
ncbi:MAG: 23S rRNA (uracil(1939)-C(5))-methyltransferase RlmD [Nitrospinales bacterium]